MSETTPTTESNKIQIDSDPKPLPTTRVDEEGFIYFPRSALIVLIWSAFGRTFFWAGLAIGLYVGAAALTPYVDFPTTEQETQLTSLLGFAFFIFVFLYLSIIASIQHKYRCYRVDEQGLHLRSGVLWKEYSVVPKNRMQHADLTHGAIERGLGLCSVVVHTAGSDETIKHLPLADGEVIVAELVEYIQSRID